MEAGLCGCEHVRQGLAEQKSAQSLELQLQAVVGSPTSVLDLNLAVLKLSIYTLLSAESS